jgi:lipoprotein-releasing system permease protein
MALPTGTRPFARFEWMIAGRYLRSRRRETFISVIAAFSFIGIMLGVATLIIVMGVMNGFRAELISKILGLNGHVIIQAMDTKLTDYSDIAARINKVPGVLSAIPLVEGQALASGPSTSSGVLVRGIRESDLPKVTGIYNNVRLGTLANFGASQGVAIGTRLASDLGLTLGQSITIVSPRGNITPLGVMPRVKAYPIVAIFEIGMAEYDSTFVIMPFAEAQAYFNLDDEASAVEVYLKSADTVEALLPAIQNAVQRQALITDWRERNVTFFSALQVERNVMFLILTLIVLVAALNIISGMTMLVKDKGHDIAILRTMGATRGTIMRVFFITGASIGTLGTLAGFVLGVAISWNVEPIRQFLSRLTQTQLFSPELYFLSELPSRLDPHETVTVIVMALVLSWRRFTLPGGRHASIPSRR